jgi:hypothetical protein
MARETKLSEIIQSCEDTWASTFPLVYYHTDRGVAATSGYKVSKGRWAVSKNLAPLDDESTSDGRGGGGGGERDGGGGGGGGSGRVARIAALNLPERPGGGGEHWKISHDKGLGWNTWLRFKMRAIFEWSVRRIRLAPLASLSTGLLSSLTLHGTPRPPPHSVHTLSTHLVLGGAGACSLD